jgi:DNA-binding HxlR family transcriptional regulator
MSLQNRRSDCPINFALELFGDRWTFLIIRDLAFKGKHAYGEFLKSEEKIATNILADRLTLLEEADIILKTPHPDHGSKYIYRLTEKGIDLVPVLIEMIMWSAKYDQHTAAEVRFIRRVKKDKAAVVREITAHLRKRLQ